MNTEEIAMVVLSVLVAEVVIAGVLVSCHWIWVVHRRRDKHPFGTVRARTVRKMAWRSSNEAKDTKYP